MKKTTFLLFALICTINLLAQKDQSKELVSKRFLQKTFAETVNSKSADTAEIPLITKKNTVNLAPKQTNPNYSESKNAKVSLTTYFEDDFSSPDKWGIYNMAENNDNWVIGTDGPSGTYPLPKIQSTTAENGFALFDSDAYCSGDQDALLEIREILDFSEASSVYIRFESFYRRFKDVAYLYIAWGDGEEDVAFIDLFKNYTNGQISANRVVFDFDISGLVAGKPQVVMGFNFYSPAAGGSGYGCGYSWMIDDLIIYEKPTEPDVKPVMAVTEYPIQPIHQSPSFEVFGVIQNSGSDLVDTPFDVTLSNKDFSTTSVAELTPFVYGDYQTVAFTEMFRPTAIGDYDMAITSLLTGDVDTNNDTFHFPVYVTVDELARETGENIAGIVGIGGNFSGYLAQLYDIKNDAKLTSITFACDSTSRTLRIDVLDDDNGKPGDVIATSGDFEITVNDNPNLEEIIFKTVQLTESIDVTSGRYYVAVYEASDVESMGIAFTFDNYIGAQGFINVEGPEGTNGWVNHEIANYNFTYVIRMHLVSENPIPNVTPATWDAGEIMIGESVWKTFILSNGGSGTLTVDNVTNLSAPWSTTFTNDEVGNISLNEGDDYEFTITFTPTDKSEVNEDFIINTPNGSFIITLKGTGNDPMSIDKTIVSPAIIYPNPSQGEFNIEVSEVSVVKIVDLLGRIVDTHTVCPASVLTVQQPTGIYFIRIESGGKATTHKVIVK